METSDRRYFLITVSGEKSEMLPRSSFVAPASSSRNHLCRAAKSCWCSSFSCDEGSWHGGPRTEDLRSRHAMDLLNSRSFRVVQSRIRRLGDGFSERRRFRLGERRKTPRRKQPRGRFLHARRPRNRARFRWTGHGSASADRGARAPRSRGRGRLAPARLRGSRLDRARARPDGGVG